jgi:hypothetical protein
VWVFWSVFIMADDNNRIGGAGTSGADLLKQAFGIGATQPRAPSEPVASASASGQRGAIGGPRGNRVLPADYPLDQLDRRAARGTYLDILV